jgi:hypothetical protein
MTAKGGITNGKSHKEGGIPMVVKSTGQKVELEGGEGVINKRNMASEKTYEFNGEKMTTCEIASEINQANGNGVKIDCDDVVGKKYAYEDGGVVFINYKENEIMYEPIDKKYWANDMEFDTIEDAQQFLDSGEIPEHIRGAYEKGLFNGGGNVYDDDGYFDLFEYYDKIPTELSLLINSYDFDDMDYNDTETLLKEVNNLGYTFDYGLDNEPYGLRPIGVELNQLKGYEEYARGGSMPNPKPLGTSLEDLHTATMSMGGYEEASAVSMTEYKNGGEVERATKHEMEHSDTINKIKRNDISTKDVARTIAKDHLKKDKDYYKKLDILESSTLAEIISNHEKNLHKKQNRKKYELGGGTEYTPHLVHIIFEDNHKSDIYTNEGKFDGEIIFKKDMLYNMEFLNNRGQETALQFPLSNKYVIVPNELISIKGYDRKYAGGGGVPSPYQSYRGRLSDNDIEILDLMRSEFRLSEDNNHFTIKQKESLSTFKGDNVVNQLSTEIISKLYGLMFKNHNAENPIQKLWIKNVGIGTLLNLAPIYLKEIVITHSENTFMQIEESILGILNEAGYKKQWKLADIDSMTKADSIMYCYPTTNPMGDSLSNLVRNANKNSTGIGIAEFTNDNFLKSFVDDIKRSNNIYKSHLVNYYKINNGITANGKVTLIYTITKM